MARWAEVSRVVDADAAPELIDRLAGMGAVGIQEDYLPGEAPPFRQPWDTGPPPEEPARRVIKAWFEEAPGILLEAELDALVGPGATLSWQSDGDWAESWKAGFSRIEVAPGLAVSPPWEAEPGDLVIEPGMAFGTGEHPTTRACLAGVARWAQAGGRCLDVGCGSGVLALAAARAGMDAWGIDIDPDAVAASLENAVRNGLSARFDATPLDEVGGRFDLVVANVYAEVLVQMAPALRRLTGGRLLLAGILADRAELVVSAMAPMQVAVYEVEGDWAYLELTA
jgi:ribosomal protein L11 methyltransferase